MARPGSAGSPTTSLPRRWRGPPLGAATAAFTGWAADDRQDLPAEVDRAFRLLATGFDEAALRVAAAGPAAIQ